MVRKGIFFVVKDIYHWNEKIFSHLRKSPFGQSRIKSYICPCYSQNITPIRGGKRP